MAWSKADVKWLEIDSNPPFIDTEHTPPPTTRATTMMMLSDAYGKKRRFVNFHMMENIFIMLGRRTKGLRIDYAQGCKTFCLSIRMFVCPSICLSVSLSICLSVRLSVSLSVRPFLYLSVRPF